MMNNDEYDFWKQFTFTLISHKYVIYIDMEKKCHQINVEFYIIRELQ